MDQETKPWYQSKTEISILVGFIVLLLLNVLPIFGIHTVEAGTAVQQNADPIVTQLLAVIGGISYIVAFVGRLTAKKQLTK